MKLDTIEKLEQKAIHDALAIWSGEKNYFAELEGYYYFPDDNFLMIALKMIPELAGFWECAYNECPNLFDGEPECELGKNYCQAEEIEPFIVVFEILKGSSEQSLCLGGRNHYYWGDMSSEYVEKNEQLDDYKVLPSKILALNLSEFSVMMF